MTTYNVFYRVEVEGYIEVEGDSPEDAEETVRDDTPIAVLIAGAHLEGGRIENVEAQVDGDGNPR